VLGSLVMVQGKTAFWLTTAIIIPIAGLGVWLFGKPNTQHMGASGLILGYFGFTLASVFFAPDLVTIIVAIIVAVLYIGLIWQIVPLKEGVSTTGHLFGFLGGVVAAAVAALIGAAG
jgi:membrane associated rhomboid family serine protease